MISETIIKMTSNPNKLYYSIGEVSEILGVNASLIRFWEKEFSIINPKKNKKGNRLFTQKDIENLQLIYHLVKEKGFTLEGANAQLKQKGDSLHKEAEMLQSLKIIKDFLLALKEEI